MKKLFALILASILLLTGCIQNKEIETIKITDIGIYFGVIGNESLAAEQREIEYTNNNEFYKKIVEEYLKGPNDKEQFESPFSIMPKLVDLKFSNGDITINLSEEFNSFSGTLHEAAVVASLVNTMVQLEEIQRVRLLVEGNDLISPSGEPYGFMKHIDYMANGDTQEITLYFANSQATYVAAEKRAIQVNKNTSKEELLRHIVDELIKGPVDENLYKTIPEGVRILSLTVEGDLVRIDFSEEMHTKHSRGAAGEDMTISSLVNTITEIDGINRVLPTVTGMPLSIEHEYVEEPLERREDRIYQQ